MPVVVPICPSGYHWDLTRLICLNDDGSNDCGLGEILGDSGCESIYGTDGCPNPCLSDPDFRWSIPWWDSNSGACDTGCPVGQVWRVGSGSDDIGQCEDIVCPEDWHFTYTGHCENTFCPVGWVRDGDACISDPDFPISPAPVREYAEFLYEGGSTYPPAIPSFELGLPPSDGQWECNPTEPFGVRYTCHRICPEGFHYVYPRLFYCATPSNSIDDLKLAPSDDDPKAGCQPNVCPEGYIAPEAYVGTLRFSGGPVYCGLEYFYTDPGYYLHGMTFRPDGICSTLCPEQECMDDAGNITGLPSIFGVCPEGSFHLESGYFRLGNETSYGNCADPLCAQPDSPQYDDFGWNKSDCICGTPRQLDSSYDAHQIYKYVFKEEQYSNADFTEDHIRVILEKWQFFNGFGWVEILDSWPKIVQARGFSPSIIKLSDGPMGLCYLDINRKPVSSKWNVPFAQESDAMQVTDLKADYVSHTQDRFGRLIVCIFGRDDQKWFVCVGKPIKRVNPGDPVWQFSDPVDMNVTDSRSMKGSVECLSQGTLMLTYTDESRATRFVINQGLADDGTGDWIPG